MRRVQPAALMVLLSQRLIARAFFQRFLVRHSMTDFDPEEPVARGLSGTFGAVVEDRPHRPVASQSQNVDVLSSVQQKERHPSELIGS